MKKVYPLALIALILAVMNIAIWQKEQILDNGEIVYLKLAPIDPRSLMQGDYMILRYEIDNQLRTNNQEAIKPADAETEPDQRASASSIIITTDTQNIAQFVRLDDGSPLNKGEKRLKLHADRYRPHIKPNSFFFQEGHGQHYQQAQYGIFTFAQDNPSDYLLTGLADKDLQQLHTPRLNP